MSPAPEPQSDSHGLGEPPSGTKVCLALQRKDAADALDIGVDTFDRHFRSKLRCVYVGRVRLYPVSELERVLRENMK